MTVPSGTVALYVTNGVTVQAVEKTNLSSLTVTGAARFDSTVTVSGAATFNTTFGAFMNMGSTDGVSSTGIIIDDEISTTSSVTYKCFVEINSGRELVFNKRNADNTMRTQSRMILMELPAVN